MSRATAHDAKGQPLKVGSKVNVPFTVTEIDGTSLKLHTVLNPTPADEVRLILDCKQVKKSEAKS